MDNNVLAFSGNNGGSYIYDGLYESYIQAKIDSEDRLAFVLKEAMVISEADYSNIRALQEAKLGDKIKSKWHRFVAFIKNMFSKFLESMNNILLDEKDYLEKYKDTILYKEGKKSIPYSYTGNYEEAVKRIKNTFVPIFSYSSYKNEFEAEDVGPLANKLVNGFNYVDGDNLAEQYKSFFLNLDHGQTSGTLYDLNFTTIYNFCYDYSNIKKILDKNLANIDASTRAIESEINKQVPASESTILTETGQGGGQTGNQTGNQAGSQAATQNNNTEKKNTGLTVNVSKAMQNIDRDENYKAKEKENAEEDTQKAKDENKNQSDITKATDRWIDVTRSIISAQITACQQIANDYMKLIREHVRSYGGQDKKSKEGTIAPKKGQTYEKSDALKKAEEENKQAGARLKQKNATT